MLAAPAVSCARVRIEAHTSIQVQPEHSGIPCAMVLRLMPRSPRRRIRFVTVASRIEDMSAPGWADASPQGVASATDARTTRFCRTQHPSSSRGFAGIKCKSSKHWRRRKRRSSARCCSLTAKPPCEHASRRRCCVHRIPPRVRDDSRSAPHEG